MTQGNIPANQLKKNDVLYFENYVSRSYTIITSVQTKIVYTAIEFDLKNGEIAIYENDVSFSRWNSNDGLYQHFVYCENPRTAIAIIDLFTEKVKFL